MKVLNYLLAISFILLGLSSCSGGDDNGGGGNSGGNTDPKSSVKITTSNQTVPQSGASASVSFTVSGNWTASSNQSWCHVSPTSGNQGTTTITVTCDDNDTYDERNATVTIKCGNASSSITVTQKQKDALLVTSNKIEVEAVGGEATIEVKANVDYNYNVEESAKSWITIGGTRALTTKNIILNIAENEEQTSREGKIIISNSEFKEEVTVYQQGATPSIVLTTKEFTVASSGETIKVELKSNTNYTIQMPKAKWITESSTRAMSSYTHYFKVEENTSYDSRSAEIIFKDESNGIEEKVTVNQLQKDAIVLAQSSYTVDYEATHLDFSVKSNVELEVSTSDSWIKQVSTRALTEKELYFDIEENNTNSERTGYIYITSGELKQTITITQRKMDKTPYVTFTAYREQTLELSKVVSSLEYSVNNSEWAELGGKKITFGGKNGDLRLRGKSQFGTNGSVIKFGKSIDVACSGDIRTLVDYEKYNSVYTGDAIFSGLFYKCIYLVQAPELPATSLAENCYAEMFYYCLSLTQAPELPATSLAKNCYARMFYNCSKLTQASELPATTLAEDCYTEMFYKCKSLVDAPKLPATTLAKNCYSGMFEDCALTQAPELPATTLAESCYYRMFSFCESMTQAPELPTTTLAEKCYAEMFYNCSSLTHAPELPATTLAEGCYSGMFGFCKSLKKTPELPATILAKDCYSSMFEGCALTQAPELPATTLAEGCYSSMFGYCSSLTQAPELPVTTLAVGCYGAMFQSCTLLAHAPELPATTLAEGCYSSMFRDCKSLTHAPELPATELAQYCYSGMFENCKSLTHAPKLPSISSRPKCYAGMFEGCTKLNYIFMLAKSEYVTYNLDRWVEGVSSTGTFVKNSEASWNVTGPNGVPSGWKVIYYSTDNDKYYLDQACTQECDDHGNPL